jgi:localization factor PodJL
MRRDQKALAAAIGALRTDLGAINEQVNAINRLGAEGHGALFDLARRMDTIAAEQPVDRDFLAAIRDDLDSMRHLVEGTAERQLHGIAAQFDDTVRRMTPDRGKLDALGDEVSALRRTLESNESPRALQRLEMRVSELGRSLEAVLAVRHSATGEVLADGVEARLQDIAAQLGDLREGGLTPMSEGIEERLEARLAEITSRLGGIMDSGAPAVIESVHRQIENHIEAVATRLGSLFEKGSQQATLALHERLQAITERIDALGADQREPAATLDVIKSEIGALRAEIAVKPTGEAPSTAHLEGQIRNLASQLEAVAGAKNEGVALANLEAQVAQLASELEQTRPSAGSLAEVEESLARLQSLLGDNAKESIATARSEARKAVSELAGMMGGNDVEAEVVHGLMRDLDSLRLAAGASDSQTRAKLESVGDTLSQVVDRLGQLESSAIRDSAPPPPAAAETPAIARLEPRELLWKSGFRPAADTAPKTAATPPATGEKKATDRRADFIAAARRAAQAAQKEVASIESAAEAEVAEPIRAGVGAGAERRPGAFARISQAIRSRKRPLLLAAAAIVLALGAMQVYGKVLPAKITPPLAADASFVAPAPKQPATVAAPARVIAPATASEATRTPTVPAVAQSALVAPAAAPDTALAFAEPENLDGLDAGHFGNGATAPNPTTFQTASQTPDSVPPDSSNPASTGQNSATASAPVNLSGASADDLNPVVLASAEVPSATGLDSRLGSDRLLSAASGGDPAAEFEIATRYADGTRVSKNLAKAAEWYGKAAEGGVAVAQYRLGSLYERGQGVTKNLVNAVDWYQRAADQGNVNAMHNLAVLMSEGVDGPPDHDKALQWFLAAGNYGVRDSQYNLGVIYARGLGVTADLAESYKWFAIAAAQGDTDASARRDEVAKTLAPDDLTKARASVSAWHVKAPIAEANGVAAPAGGWDGSAQMIGEADRQALVKKIQTLLADQGFDPGPADGVAGKKTADAVRAYQRKVGAPETGQIDNVLVASLSEVNQ